MKKLNNMRILGKDVYVSNDPDEEYFDEYSE